ncbi:MAG: M23 family metallopeptidase [Clostridia bacterium]|nr:M23 family metallopeptidase [Clostridia bacterium]
MNKKLIFLILVILLVPTALAAVWFFSVSGSDYTPKNVSSITLTSPDGDCWIYTEESEKEFFTTLAQNLVSIEKQTYCADTWTLYRLELERTFDTDTFNLCLARDAKNCLAYDDDGNWYRIDTENARQFLVREELEGVYTNSTYPSLSLVLSGNEYTIEPQSYKWNYLLADGSFSGMTNDGHKVTETDLVVSASVGLTVSYSVTPDWCDIKIFNGEELVFSGDINALGQFSYKNDAVLRALVSAEWYQDDSKLYYGNTVSEFLFNYDVRATASLNKDSFIPGEIAYVTLENALNDNFFIQTNVDTSKKLEVREYNGKSLLALPISYENKTGEYSISLVSDNSNIKLGFTVSERLIEDVDVSLSNATAYEYQTALESFFSEISLETYASELNEPKWRDGFITPVIKFDGEKERYWISAPSYGAVQIVDGMKISVKNFGTHYIKSVDFPFIQARAVTDGIVAFAGTTSAFGNTLVLDHGMGLMTVYGHIEELAVSVGDYLKKGDLIGNSSDSGIVMKDAQIFFGVMQDGVFVNPYMLINEQKSSTDTDISDAPYKF